MPREKPPVDPDDAAEASRLRHRLHFNAEWARNVLVEACNNSVSARIDAAICSAIAEINVAAKRERNATVLDFVRADVRDGVADELNARGFQVALSTTRSCAEAGEDAVSSLVVRW